MVDRIQLARVGPFRNRISFQRGKEMRIIASFIIHYFGSQGARGFRGHFVSRKHFPSSSPLATSDGILFTTPLRASVTIGDKPSDGSGILVPAIPSV
jgi:hypothetical protein